MAFISRRRHFTLLVVTCCLSLFIFGWNSRTQDAKDVRMASDILPTKGNENLISKLLSTDSKGVYYSNLGNLPSDDNIEMNQPLPPLQLQELPKEHREVRDPLDPPQSQELQNDENVFLPREPEKSEHLFRLPDNKLLFSGPTDYEKVVTMPYRRHPDQEEEFSGPTNYGDIPGTFPLRHEPGTELKFSGQTEDCMLAVTKQLPPSEQSNEIKLSKTSENYHELSLDGTVPGGSQMAEPTKKPSLIIDTAGCKIPKLDPWDPTVKKFIEVKQPYECPGPPLFLKSKPDGSVILNETVLQTYYNISAHELQCFFQPIYRKHEDPGNVRETDIFWGNVSKLDFGVQLDDDYIGVFCPIGNTFAVQYFPLVHLKKEIEEERNSVTPPTPRLNIILAGIDSVSKLNFLRHFPRTQSFLKEKLSPFEMNGYTKVGDNTFPNLVPMLTGHFVEHYWNESLRDEMYFDDIDLIWKDYAKKGYRTFYAEDSPFTGTFNYLKRGFYDPPTDYYLRPLALVIENSVLRTNATKKHCLNSQLETELIYDFLRDFVQAMGDRPYIAFAMVSTITHDYLNHASWADEPTIHILEDLFNVGALNSSLLVLFSDHGLRYGQIRWTYIGKFEERMPFMYIHAPTWFLDQYPEYAKNLKINQNRLITLFDIHATMIHLLDLSKTPEERSDFTLGSSLLDEISPNRTCTEANILPHWCPCQTFENVGLNSSEAVNASQAIIDDINNKLEEYGGVCEVLEVAKIMDAMIGQANDLLLQFVSEDDVVINRTVVYGNGVNPLADYMITLVAKPGGAVFEGTVRHDTENDSYSVLGISRLSLYGNTSWCIDSQKMKIFCYCKIQKI